jgi:protein transport protein SEC20
VCQEASTASLKATSSTHDILTGLLGTSKQLVTALEKADWLDRLLIFAALTFFVLVILFILKQRIVDRGLRIAFFWTRFLPLMERADSQLVANKVVMEKATARTDIATLASSIATSMTAALASQIVHAAGSGGNPLSTSVPDAQHDTSSALPHETVDLDAVGSGLSPTLTVSTSETPHLDSIHDEL